MEAALIIGGICLYAAAVCFGVLVVAHITAQLAANRQWRKMERERKAALRSGEILTGRKGGAV
jgi:membrane protein implicated in regulation of membrane protease activity